MEATRNSSASRDIAAKYLKPALRSAVVGVLSSVVAQQVLGVDEPWHLGAKIGLAHYLVGGALGWLYRDA